MNSLLALMDEQHVHHARAQSWWTANSDHGWASCPLTQNGFVRVFSQPGYSNPQTAASAISQLTTQIANSDHEFWADDISITDPALFDHTRIFGPKQITDVYLLALAVRRGGRLVTFDEAVSIAAVRSANAENVVTP